MDKLKKGIKKNFGKGSVPTPESLVFFDGFDGLEKEIALEFFANKTWEDVLVWLKGDNHYYLEELVCLNLQPLNYYYRAYFEFAFYTLEEDEPNEDYLMWFFSQFYQLKYMGKYSLIDKNRKKLFSDFAKFVKENNSLNSLHPDDKDSILKGVELFENFTEDVT